MKCTIKEQDLLLLAHRALSVKEAAVTIAHLCVCADCRARYDRLVAVSTALSQMPGTSGQGGELSSATQVIALTAAGILLTLVILVILGVAAAHTFFPQQPHVQDILCTPGLPNSQCK